LGGGWLFFSRFFLRWRRLALPVLGDDAAAAKEKPRQDEKNEKLDKRIHLVFHFFKSLTNLGQRFNNVMYGIILQKTTNFVK
jgi:hypothetical protein